MVARLHKARRPDRFFSAYRARELRSLPRTGDSTSRMHTPVVGGPLTRDERSRDEQEGEDRHLEKGTESD